MAKQSIGADVLKHIICTIKIRKALQKNDNVDSEPIITTTTSDIKPISIVVEDKGYDSEVKHVLVKVIKTYSIIHILDRSMLLY